MTRAPSAAAAHTRPARSVRAPIGAERPAGRSIIRPRRLGGVGVALIRAQRAPTGHVKTRGGAPEEGKTRCLSACLPAAAPRRAPSASPPPLLPSALPAPTSASPRSDPPRGCPCGACFAPCRSLAARAHLGQRVGARAAFLKGAARKAAALRKGGVVAAISPPSDMAPARRGAQPMHPSGFARRGSASRGG